MDDGNTEPGAGVPTGKQHLLDPAEAFSELGRMVLGEDSLETVLDRVALLAQRTIPGVAAVSVTLIHGEHANTAAFTHDVAMASEQRWPKFSPHAVQSGVYSSLSVGLPVREQVIGALNIYAGVPETFALELARTFASYAAVALADTSLYTSTAELAAQLQQAMESRKRQSSRQRESSWDNCGAAPKQRSPF